MFRKIKEKSGIPVEELRLLYGPKQLEKGKYLSDYHVENNSTLYLVLRLKGGMSMDENQKQLDDDVELTYEPDMITWDDDPDNLRAKMPCGHAIGKASPAVERPFHNYTTIASQFVAPPLFYVDGLCIQSAPLPLKYLDIGN